MGWICRSTDADAGGSAATRTRRHVEHRLDDDHGIGPVTGALVTVGDVGGTHTSMPTESDVGRSR